MQEKNISYKKVLDFLNWFNTLWRTANPVTLDEVEKIFAPDIAFYMNGQLAATGIHAYLERLNTLKSKTKFLEIKFPLNEMLVEENRVAVIFEERITFYDGSVRDLVSSAFIHFNHEGKIVKFFEMFSGMDPI